MDILQEIVAHKRTEVEFSKQRLAPSTIYAQTEALLAAGEHPTRSMAQALTASSSGIIAEFKRRSPSKGWIKKEGRVEQVAPAYEKAGAAALSILTDEQYFGGELSFISKARDLVQAPIMRKEFIIDEYQLFEARLLGADAVLLIASCLSREECRALIETSHQLSLEVLLELHEVSELSYADLPADMIGVNNRHLGTFVTTVQKSLDLLPQLPADRVLVSESGLSEPATVRSLRELGYRGFLMGEQFMKQADPGCALANFIAAL